MVGTAQLPYRLKPGLETAQIVLQLLPKRRQLRDQQGNGLGPQLIGVQIAQQMTEAEVLLQLLLGDLPQQCWTGGRGYAMRSSRRRCQPSP